MSYKRVSFLRGLLCLMGHKEHLFENTNDPDMIIYCAECKIKIFMQKQKQSLDEEQNNKQ